MGDVTPIRKDSPGHSVDAVVPSETAQFDQISSGTKPSVSQAKLILQLKRAGVLGAVLLNSPGGPAAAVQEMYVQKVLARAELTVVSEIIEAKLGITPEDFIAKVADQLEKMMDMEQLVNKLIITPDGVYKDG